ncbi:hypothetical protein BVER_03327 [Candidatus Burkholderia verschuerenii]|uniref:DUF2486 domain-containing protein n=1 Tax=Candidatus Burkholderia verschuerenii TaxID=242163 RepID=A0A0L0MAY8_9BURK|nr:DUF2486 family protein [Candidatus Burkholderia verschuerenii]KND59441.1 hypothetical protein BVER_03327 [Candidatus Burkholderia verschuerenii]
MTNTPDSFDSSIPVLTDVVRPGKPDYARAASAEGSIEPSAVNPVVVDYDSTRVAERVRGRVTQFLNGDGRAVIEARCEEMLREHSAKIVQALSNELTAALESRMRAWVGEAVEEELRRQREG